MLLDAINMGASDLHFEPYEKFKLTGKELLKDIAYDNGGIPTTEKKFFYILRGEKTAAKQLILSKCLILCALKWRKLHPPKEVGEILFFRRLKKGPSI